MRRARSTTESGVTLVELAVVFPLLLLIALGAYEFGMLFRDSLTVATAAREAGRVAASSANYGDADCVIIEAAAGVLQAVETGATNELHIYKSDANGNIPLDNAATMRRYRPAAPLEPAINCGSSRWVAIHLGGGWDPEDRVNNPQVADWIGVRVEYSHAWATGFLWFSGTTPLADEAVFRIEPPAPD